MKKIIVLVILVASILVLAGCQVKDKPSSTTTSTAVVSSSSNESRNLKPVEPGTLPELNQQEKAQVNDNLEPAVDSIDSALKSLDEVKDIDLSSIDK